MTTMTMTTKEQILSDILVTAVEGGSCYWANIRSDDGHLQAYEVCRDTDLNIERVVFDKRAVEDVAGVEVRPGLTVLEGAGRTMVSVDHQAVRWALRAIARGKVVLRKDLVATVRGIVFDGDEDDVLDAEGADCVLQVALFGQVIYS